MKNSLVKALAVQSMLLVAGGIAAPHPLWAEVVAGQGATVSQGQSAVAGLIVTMKIDQVIEVLRVEGVDYGASIEDEMFPEAGGEAWMATVARIYDPVAMKAAFAEKLVAGLQDKPDAVAEMQRFFGSALGQNVLNLELEARRQLLDDEAEAGAQLAWGDLSAKGGPRVDLLRGFVEANDLIDSNVMGALNSNLAFYQGMAASGAFEGEMSEDDMLADVWTQEPEIRQQTEDWVYPYLNLAYSSLSDEDLQAYVDFSGSSAGKVLNAALFAAFDAVFVPISQNLGAAAALQMKGQDI